MLELYYDIGQPADQAIGKTLNLVAKFIDKIGIPFEMASMGLHLEREN